MEPVLEIVTQDYMFLADCHGLQSLNPVDPGVVTAAMMGCDANFQRRSLIGTVTLQEDIKHALDEMMNTDSGKKVALLLIKDGRYMLPQGKVTQWKRFMDQIPNDELDPFWHSTKKET